MTNITQIQVVIMITITMDTCEKYISYSCMYFEVLLLKNVIHNKYYMYFKKNIKTCTLSTITKYLI